jgi:hypothetical protein
MMDAKKIFLHIGTHKTGTTSLQMFLTRNADAFSQEDILIMRNPYYTTINDAAHFWQMSNAVVRPQVVTGPRLKYDFPNMSKQKRFQILQGIREGIDLMPHKKVVISSEGFSFVRTKEEIDLLRRAFPKHEFHIICVFRERSAFLSSVENQIKKANTWDSILDPAHPLFRAPGLHHFTEPSWLTEYNKIRWLWKQLGEFHEISYEAALARSGSVLPEILEKIGVSETLKNLSTKAKFKNRRVDLDS